ncbi:MAG: 16S rRNA methyltransferase [Archaeoglobaceae archaeon]|nr:16S rRNA methyltransferase [Archaeoglobaceae archaeon]
MLTFVFLETALELIPKEISKHPAVVKDARRRKKNPSKIILDDSKHHPAMKKIKDRKKRGRPDIIHYCLLSLLDSKINEMEIFVHTVNNNIIWINRKTRLPRNYNRFVGLMEDLFDKRVIKAENEILMEIKDIPISSLISSFSNKNIVLMIESGDKDEKHLRNLMKEDPVICIGCFPHGNFSNDILQLMNDVNADFVSLGDKPLTSLYVTNRVVCLYENARVQTY